MKYRNINLIQSINYEYSRMQSNNNRECQNNFPRKQLGKSEKIAQICEKYFINLQLIFEVK